MSPQVPGKATFTVIAEKMTMHFQPAPSEIVQCFRFNTRVRRPHETVTAYISQLKQLAEHCNYGNEVRLNEMIWDRLVCGIANERLLAEDDLSNDKATKLLLSFEAAEKETKDLVRSEICKYLPRTTRICKYPPRTTGICKYRLELPVVINACLELRGFVNTRFALTGICKYLPCTTGALLPNGAQYQ